MLSDEQVELVNRLQRGQFGDVNFNEYQVGFVDAAPSVVVMQHLVTKRCSDARLFMPRPLSLRWSSSAAR